MPDSLIIMHMYVYDSSLYSQAHDKIAFISGSVRLHSRSGKLVFRR